LLEHTFIHLPGVGPAIERRLWRAGILTWEDFIRAGSVPGLSRARRAALASLLEGGRERLDDLGYWCRLLPQSEQWRLYGRFRDRTAFLDIETSGLTVEQGGEVSLIGLYDGRVFRPFVNGFNLDRFEEALEKVELLITFNGARFDLPYLAAYFRHLRLPQGHVDLLYPLRRLGCRGGLKRIEVLFGLRRDKDIEGLDGWAAVLLWRRYLAGEPAAMGRLIRYNRADTVNLKTIMDKVYDRLRLELIGPAAFALEDPLWREGPGLTRPEPGMAQS